MRILGERENRKSGKQENRKTGKQENRKTGKQENRKKNQDFGENVCLFRQLCITFWKCHFAHQIARSLMRMTLKHICVLGGDPTNQH